MQHNVEISGGPKTKDSQKSLSEDAVQIKRFCRCQNLYAEIALH